MSVHVTSAHRANELLPLLARRLSTPQDDILAPDIVVVPGQGMVDLLQESLSTHMESEGIVANLHFWHPSEFTLNATGQFDDQDHTWDPAHLQWTLLEYLATHISESELLAPGFSTAQRKLSYSRRVAELFDHYAVHRPEMILEWNEGHDTDGLHPLTNEYMWQAALWRAVRSRIGESGPERAARHDFLSPNAHPLLARARLSLFGLESLSRATIEMLRLLGHEKDIHVFHLTPVADAVQKMRTEESVVHQLRRNLHLAGKFRNPLMMSWSQSALESAALVASVATDVDFVKKTPQLSVLGVLQEALSNDKEVSGDIDQSTLLGMSDGSIQIHRCHGATRQVEVLRDSLLHVLDADPSMSPRDILVLCPDLERFGPIIEPVMSARLGNDASRLRVAIVDRSHSTTSPIAVSIDTVLGLAGGRCTSLDVLEALSLDPVRRRFDISDNEFSLISSWVSSLNIRWGLDAAQRGLSGYPEEFEEGSWQWAIDRLTTGILVQSADPLPIATGLSPFDDVSGTDVDTIGKLHAFHRELSAIRTSVVGENTLGHWSTVLQHVCDAFVAPDPETADHVLDVRDVIADLTHRSHSAPTATFGLQEFRTLLMSTIPTVRGRAMKWADVVRIGSQSRFRGVSARVVAILGFDEDAFRGGHPSGDDILARDPWIGERDGRADECVGLLTTIHSASDHLIITCDGHDINDNSEVPMPVRLEELKDAVVNAISIIPEQHRGAKPLIINHSRQAADLVNLGVPSPDERKNVTQFVDGPWTFDPAIASVIGAVRELDRMDLADDGFGTPILPEPSDDHSITEVELGQLEIAMKRPTEVFITQRLGVVMPADEGIDDPEIPLWPTPLDYGSLGRDLLEHRSLGESSATWWSRRKLLGGLPLGPMADAVMTKLDQDVEAILTAADQFLAAPPRQVRLNVRIPLDDRSAAREVALHGSVYVREDRLVSLNFSKWHPRMRLQPWIQIAALTLQDPNIRWQATVVARNDESRSKAGDPPPAPTKVVEFSLRGDSIDSRRESALRVLRLATNVRITADRIPIPLFERSSWRHHERSKTAIERDLNFDLDRPSHRLVYGTSTLRDLRALEPLEDIDLPTEGNSRFDAYAELLTSTWGSTTTSTGSATSSEAEELS